MTISRLKTNVKMSINVKRHSSSHHSLILIPHLKGNYREQLSSLIYTHTQTHIHKHTHTQTYTHKQINIQWHTSIHSAFLLAFTKKTQKAGGASAQFCNQLSGLCCPVTFFYTSWLSFSRGMHDLYFFLRWSTQLIFTRSIHLII